MNFGPLGIHRSFTVRGVSFNVIGSICNSSCRGIREVSFVDLPFYWGELVRDFGGLGWDPFPFGFLANPQLSTGLVSLYQLPFELG